MTNFENELAKVLFWSNKISSERKAIDIAKQVSKDLLKIAKIEIENNIEKQNKNIKNDVIVQTIITKQLSYDRCEDFIKTKSFKQTDPLYLINDWIKELEKEQMNGTEMSNVNIIFR